MAKSTTGTKTSTNKATSTKTPKEDPLAAYLQPLHQGDAAGGFWEASLTEGGHSVSLHAKTKDEIVERAKAILAARGIAVQPSRGVRSPPMSDPDPVRLLHRHSEVGYTDHPWLALRDEPEAVSADDQKWLTVEAEERAKARRRATWERTRGRLQRELDHLEAQSFGRSIRDDLRVLRHGIVTLDKRLA